MLSCEKNEKRNDDIKLPKQTGIEIPKPANLTKITSGNLSEMNNFDPTIACTPPDKGFMENLMRRMERS